MFIVWLLYCFIQAGCSFLGQIIVPPLPVYTMTYDFSTIFYSGCVFIYWVKQQLLPLFTLCLLYYVLYRLCIHLTSKQQFSLSPSPSCLQYDLSTVFYSNCLFTRQRCNILSCLQYDFSTAFYLDCVFIYQTKKQLACPCLYYDFPTVFYPGCVFIYRTKNSFQSYDSSLDTYCDKHLYWFAFWITTAVYIIMAASCFCVCCLGCLASVFGNDNERQQTHEHLWDCFKFLVKFICGSFFVFFKFLKAIHCKVINYQLYVFEVQLRFCQRNQNRSRLFCVVLNLRYF